MKQLKYVVVVMALFNFVPALQVSAMAESQKAGRVDYSGEKLECNLREAKRIAAKSLHKAVQTDDIEVMIVGNGSAPK